MKAAVRVTLLALGVATAMRASEAGAAEGSGRAVLVHVEGPEAEEARRAIVAALPEGTRIVPSSADAAAWRASAAGRGKRSDPATHLARAARALHADAAILVTSAIARKGGARAMHVTVLASGERSEATVPRHDSEALSRALAPLHDGEDAPARATVEATPRVVARDEEAKDAKVHEDDEAPPLATAAPAESSPEGPPGKDDLARSSSETREPGHAMINVSAGIEIGTRDFRYNDRRSAALRDYALTAAPLVTLGGEAYPFAAQRHGAAFVADLGVAGDYAHAFALSSSAPSGGSVGTGWSRFALGPRVRLRPFGEGGPLFHATVQYGEETFSLSTVDTLGNAVLPAVAYRFVRPDVDARFALGRFAVHAGAGYLVVLGGGELADRFPSASIGGVEGRLGASLTLLPGLELRADADYRRYFYSLHPSPGSAAVAGGALDQLAGGTVAVAFLL